MPAQVVSDSVPLEAFFLPATDGQRFAIYHPPQGSTPKGQVLYVHPFAEEMNKARRMAALQARQLAMAGFGVLQLDLQGCGDSSGDFGEASWQGWVEDVVHGASWLQARLRDAPLWLWGLRAGCLLAVSAAAQLTYTPNYLFWAPTPAGKPLLQQFLRLKAAADLASGNAKNIMNELRQQITQGMHVEIAGYSLAPQLATGLEQATLQPPAGNAQVLWFELSTQEDATMPPAAARSQDAWQQAGYAVKSQLVVGPSFWQTTEIEDAPALLAATTAALRGGAPTRHA